jgi:uncharacterized delta-60 repeat protein
MKIFKTFIFISITLFVFMYDGYCQTLKLDTDFGVYNSFCDPVYNREKLINSVAVQSDGKIIVAGNFVKFGLHSINRIARLNVDGSLDMSFNPGIGPDAEVLKIVIQPDDKIIVGGAFNSYNGFSDKKGIVRLNPDGILDPNFTVNQSFTSLHVHSIALQTDGNILIGGSRYTLDSPNIFLSRLLPSGATDHSFEEENNLDGIIHAIAVQGDGKIFVGGEFDSFRNDTSYLHLVKLNPDGSIDLSFVVPTSEMGTDVDEISNDPFPATPIIDGVFSIAIQADMKVLVGGIFDGSNSIKRLTTTGALDPDFIVGSERFRMIHFVSSLLIDGEGRILVSGDFNHYNGIFTRSGLVRLLSDGSIDNYYPFKDFYISEPGKGLCLLKNNEVIAFNGRNVYDGKLYYGIVKINEEGIVDETFCSSTAFGAEPNGPADGINTIAFQKDKKILVSKKRAVFNGYQIYEMTRLNYDGTIDETFYHRPYDRSKPTMNFTAIACQENGKILACNIQEGLKRYNADGTTDNSFPIGEKVAYATKIEILKNGKILFIESYNNERGIFRLNEDGSLDESFESELKLNSRSWVVNFVVQPDNKILLSYYDESDKPFSNKIVRLMEDGSLDPGFNSEIKGLNEWGKFDYLFLLRDGRIVVAGTFYMNEELGVRKNQIVILNQDGSINNSFNIGANPSTINSVVLYNDDCLIVSYDEGYSPRATKIVSLNLDGSFNKNMEFGGGASQVRIDPWGKIYLFGNITSYDSTYVNGFCRLEGYSVVDDVKTKITHVDQRITLYPNPSNGELNVILKNNHSNSKYELNIYSISGESLASYSIDSDVSKLNIEGISPGFYIVKVTGNDGVELTGKLIIN